MDKRIIWNGVLVAALLAFVFNAGVWGLWTFVGSCTYGVIRLSVSIVGSYRRFRLGVSGSRREYVVKLTAKLMGLFFITGTLIFMFTFRSIGHLHHVVFNNTELIVRSMMGSLDMFMLGVDSNILDRLDEDAFLKSVIMVQAALSFLCTMVLLISLVYSRVKAYYMLHRRTRITEQNNHLYIFFGINENSKLLAKDIHRHDPRALTLFVDYSDMEESDGNSWETILSFFIHRQKTFDFARETDSLVAIASKQLCDLDSEQLNGKDVDVFALLGIEKVKDLINNLHSTAGGAWLRIFFFSDNEDNNIRSLINIAKDTMLLKIAETEEVRYTRTLKDREVQKKRNDAVGMVNDIDDMVSVLRHRIYCHARYNGPNRVVEDLAVLKGLNVEIVDSSHLAVEGLKYVGENHPVRVAHLSLDESAVVTESLQSLIVGFGEVGRDAFRYIYEFGTFIRISDGRADECKPEITAIDSRMEDLKGLFMANTPAIDYAGESIKLRQMSCTEEAFFNECLSPRKCRSLNYIVLALGDDDRNIALATVIFNRMRRYREDMTHLMIMVRCVKDEKREMMQKIADHYNRGCSEPDCNVIRLFGNPEEIYTYDLIIKDELTKRGMEFLNRYRHLAKEGLPWNGRRSALTGADRRLNGETVVPNIDKLRKLRRQESQDLSNTLHADTKIWLLKKSLGEGHDWTAFLGKVFDKEGYSLRTGRGAGLTYPGLDERENKVMLHLAMLEHARWNAAHELLGYEPRTDKTGCDERRLLHNCLIGWDRLDEESRKASDDSWQCDYKTYDFCVVDCSIALATSSLTGGHSGNKGGGESLTK